MIADWVKGMGSESSALSCEYDDCGLGHLQVLISVTIRPTARRAFLFGILESIETITY